MKGFRRIPGIPLIFSDWGGRHHPARSNQIEQLNCSVCKIKRYSEPPGGQNPAQDPPGNQIPAQELPRRRESTPRRPGATRRPESRPGASRRLESSPGGSRKLIKLNN